MPSHIPTPDRSPTVQVNIKNLIDEVQCYRTVRELRWPDGIRCPSCESTQVTLLVNSNWAEENNSRFSAKHYSLYYNGTHATSSRPLTRIAHLHPGILDSS
jgi:hypothetical protein